MTALFHHQGTVINPAHIVALRTEHPLANGKLVVALYTAYGKPIQLTMTPEERDALVAAMEETAHDYDVAVAPDVSTEVAARIAAGLRRVEREGGKG